MALSRKQASLWILIAGPTAWAVHFLVSYWVAAAYCAKAGREAALAPARTPILWLSAAAIIVILALGVAAWRQHRAGRGGSVPHREDTALDRQRFLGFATLLLCGLSVVAVVYTTMVVFFFETCQ